MIGFREALAETTPCDMDVEIARWVEDDQEWIVIGETSI